MIDLNNKQILITGAPGSWGQTLTRKLLKDYNVKKIIAYSRGEHNQFEMNRTFNSSKIKYVMGDVRDYNRLHDSMLNCDVVFHLAAIKVIHLAEDNDFETIKTNILGTENVIRAAIANKVKLVVLVSTDKACNPSSIYGTSKLAAEKLIINANKRTTDTTFVCIRAGNVIASNGSVIPYFIEHAKKKDHMPITDPKMTRYLMTLQDAIVLVLKAAESCMGGEIFVTKMPAVKITDLAEVVWNYYNPNEPMPIEIVGIRPGEKLDEDLVSNYEARSTVVDDNFRIILPETGPLRDLYKNYKPMEESHYSSNTSLLNKEEILQLLNKAGVFNEK